MMDWLNDGSLQALIGFTGTAEAYRSRFTKLGLQLVYSIPIDELIAAGFVAPFTEMGAPFSYSTRERRIRELLDTYKAHTSAFIDMLGRLVKNQVCGNPHGGTRLYRSRVTEHVP
jgi:superfamily II DNA or RNA helicase